MKKVIRTILLITNIISFALLSLYAASGIITALFSTATYLKFLAKLGITWSYDTIMLFAYGSFAILIITYLLRKKFLMTFKDSK